jgi:hypothetical protein
VQCLGEIPRGRVLVGDEQGKLQRGIVLADGRGRAGDAVAQRLAAERDRAGGRQVRREVAAGDLRRRPPERARGHVAVQGSAAADDGAATARGVELRAQVQRRATRE